MVCGYVYGIPKGFLPAFIGDVLGASAGFWLYRLALHGYIRRKFKDNLEYQEMSNAVSKNGLFILFLIRLSSFPFAGKYIMRMNCCCGLKNDLMILRSLFASRLPALRVVLNAYFGAMTQLPYWKFILATTLSTPRLFLPIFIGHNISTLSDPEIKGKDRILKWAGNVLGIVLALAIGWYIYRHTTRRIHRINAGLSAEENEMDCAGDEQDYQRQHLAAPYPQQQQFQQMPPNYHHQYSQLPHQDMPNQQGGYQQYPQQQQYSSYHSWDNRRDDSHHEDAATAVVMVEEGAANQCLYRTPSPVSTQSRSVETIAVAAEESKSDRQQQQQ
ncbi:unnamed protein product [Mortierella alpina]